MNKRWLFLLIVILVTSFYLTSSGIVSSNGEQTIRGQVNSLFSSQDWSQSANNTESVDTSNQTVLLKNPTFQELKDFVLTDYTHRHAFIPNEYECRNFATDMVNNAVHQGLLAGFALLCYNQGQHAVVAFNTTDRGLIYIEPQTNAAIDVKVGGTYQDLEIKQILVAW